LKIPTGEVLTLTLFKLEKVGCSWLLIAADSEDTKALEFKNGDVEVEFLL